MLFMFKFQEYARYLTDIHFLPNPFGLTLFLPKVLYANITGFLNNTYRTICIWLNDKGKINSSISLKKLYDDLDSECMPKN